MKPDNESQLVESARAGDKAALAELIGVAQQLTYRLAIRMVPDVAEAQDLTQEILIRVVTGLAKFRGDSSFKTWVYRVASNHLLTARKRLAEQRLESFEAMASKLAEGVADEIAAATAPLDDQLLVEEAKLTCTGRMLTGLDREHRLAFILGEVLELTGPEAADVLGVDAATFRKRLSRARERMTAFTDANCGIVNPARACRCEKQAQHLIRLGAFDPDRRPWTTHPTVQRQPARGSPAQVARLENVERTIALFKSHPDYAAPALTGELRRLIDEDPTGLMS